MISNRDRLTETAILRKQIEDVQKTQNYWEFYRFMLEEWGEEGQDAGCEKETAQKRLFQGLTEQADSELEEKKRQAYRRFCAAVRGHDIAKSSVIRTWFGIGSHGKPSREKIFQIAFALQFDVAKTERYLQQGLLQPGIQLNDYREFIFRYGLDSSLSYEKCKEMIFVFEKQIAQDIVIEQKTHTDMLREMYDLHYTREPEDFLVWMCQQAGYFKGYSKTALKHFQALKTGILDDVCKDARNRIERLLVETDFAVWEKQYHHDGEERGDAIYRWIRNDDKKQVPTIDAEIKEEIRTEYHLAYASRKRNSDLLNTLYASAIEYDAGSGKSSRRGTFSSHDEFSLPETVSVMTDKYLSQLLGVAEKKERQIRLCSAIAKLDGMSAKEDCPEDIAELLYMIETKKNAKKLKSDKINVETAARHLKKCLKEQKAACHIVQREDLLPLLHCMAQMKYQEECGDNYQQKDAREYFENMANGILFACGMAPLNEKYVLDYLLLSTFMPLDMYSYSDLLEITRQN
ncbi:MAG: hypothetical protein LUH14_06880 [Clostridiaceae bacterium]|nr:hypothetical protein [Clostridiaceae bacterium]